MGCIDKNTALKQKTVKFKNRLKRKKGLISVRFYLENVFIIIIPEILHYLNRSFIQFIMY